MKKKLIALTVALAMVFSVMPGFAATASAEEVGQVTVTAGASSVNEEETFDFVKQKITVSGDTAESYGYTDNGDTSKVTVLDVFAAMHKAKYGKAFNKNTATDYLDVPGGWIQRIFVRKTMNVSYFVNRAMTSTTASETFLKDGDTVDLFGLQDTYYYGDYFSYFKEDTKTATAGKEFTLTLMGAMCWTTDFAPIGNENGGTIKLATVSANGELTALSAKPDANGVCKLKFDKAGTYYVSAFGKTYYESIGEIEPISLPFCKVTVKAATSTPTKPTTPSKPAKPAPLKKPVLKAAGDRWSSIKVSWTKVPKATKYYLYRAKVVNGRVGTYYKWKTTTSTVYYNRGLQAGKQYAYRVKAVNSKTVSPLSNDAKATVAAKAPTLKLVGKKNRIKATWSKVEGADGYVLYRYDSKKGKFVINRVAKGNRNCDYTAINKKSGKTYKYKVRAYRIVKGKRVYTVSSTIKSCKAK